MIKNLILFSHLLIFSIHGMNTSHAQPRKQLLKRDKQYPLQFNTRQHKIQAEEIIMSTNDNGHHYMAMLNQWDHNHKEEIKRKNSASLDNK